MTMVGFERPSLFQIPILFSVLLDLHPLNLFRIVFCEFASGNLPVVGAMRLLLIPVVLFHL